MLFRQGVPTMNTCVNVDNAFCAQYFRVDTPSTVVKKESDEMAPQGLWSVGGWMMLWFTESVMSKEAQKKA